LPGDTLQIIDSEIYIDGVKSPRPKKVQYQYMVNNGGVGINQARLTEWGIDESDYWQNQYGQQGFFLDDDQVANLRGIDPKVRVERIKNGPDPLKLFPHDPANNQNWSVDNYGPLWIPKKGVTIDINLSNISLYTRVIGVYEQNDLKVEGETIYINGAPATTYTFKQDYYFGMGDNRHNSEDSRMWGFIPHDHIVGEPLFIWFSAKDGNPLKGIHWNRIFTSARSK
jgi:signal peptidase I